MTALIVLVDVTGAKSVVVVVAAVVEVVVATVEAFVSVKTSIKRRSGLDHITRCAARKGGRRSGMVLAG
ncbi:MAG: hypothetical protein ACYC19_03290 [Acidimicrobiales bacterium]